MIKIIVGIVAIVVIVVFALWRGVDGAVVMSSVAVIGGVLGYEAKALRDKAGKKG